MPPKKRTSRPKGFRATRAPPNIQYGGGFVDWVKGAANTVYNSAIKPAAKWVKDNHVISTAAGFIPHPAGKAASAVLRQAGFGKKKRKAIRKPAFAIKI